MKKLILVLSVLFCLTIIQAQNSTWPYPKVEPTSTDTLMVWHQDSTKVITMSEFVWANGLNPLTANWDIGAYILTGLRFVSDVATGTAPFTVASTTVVSNLNSDLLDGQEGSYYMDNATHTGEVTGSGALTIADDIIEAANLETTNSPTDNYLPSYDAASGGFTWVESSGGGTTTMTDMNGTAWRFFYSNGSGDVTELAFGADGTFLKSNGVTSAPSFATPAGAGNVSNTGTPVDNQIAIFIDATTVEGDSDLTFDGTNLAVNGRVTSGSLVVGSGNNPIAEIEVDTDTNVATLFDAAGDTLYVKIPVSFMTQTASVAPLLLDTVPAFIFGAGAGEDGDSILFEEGDESFGAMHNKNDTMVIVNFDNIYLTPGDSLKWNAYYGDMMAGTKTDSLFTAPQACGCDQTVFTPDNATKIPPGNDFWIAISGTQPTNMSPKKWILQANKKTLRD